MKATAQMGGLTEDEIESWRAVWNSTYRDFPEPYRQLNELCDLALQAINRWVPVSERLPKEGVGSILFAGNHVTYGWFRARGGRSEPFEGCFGVVRGVTHWQPLPPPTGAPMTQHQSDNVHLTMPCSSQGNQ